MNTAKKVASRILMAVVSLGILFVLLAPPLKDSPPLVGKAYRTNDTFGSHQLAIVITNRSTTPYALDMTLEAMQQASWQEYALEGLYKFPRITVLLRGRESWARLVDLPYEHDLEIP